MSKKTKIRNNLNIRKSQKKKRRQALVKKKVLLSQLKSQPNVEDLVDNALECIEKGDIKKGERLLNNLKKKHKYHSHIYYGLGILAAFDNRLDEAIQFFTKATDISSDFVEAHYNLGVAYQKQFRVPEMISAYRQVIKYGEPGSQLVHHAQKLIGGLARQIQVSDGVSLDEYLIGYQIFDQGVKFMETANWEEAIAKFNETVKIAPNHAQCYGNLGICYSSLGQQKEALNAFDRAIEIDPYYELALVNRKIAESLSDGECLNLKVKSIEYYKEYTYKNKSYIKEYIDSQNLLPGNQ